MLVVIIIVYYCLKYCLTFFTVSDRLIIIDSFYGKITKIMTIIKLMKQYLFAKIRYIKIREKYML